MIFFKREGTLRFKIAQETFTHNIFLLGVTCVAAALLFSACDVVYSYLDKAGAEEKKLIGEALPFERNPRVEEVQTLLNLYGYSAGIPDGILGFRTRQSVEQFQKDNNLKVTRFVDRATWQKLNAFHEVQLVVNNKLNIRLIQKILKVNGYDIGNIDGKMGNRTVSAIKSFQKKYNLNPDGKVGYKTLIRLVEYLRVDQPAEAALGRSQ